MVQLVLILDNIRSAHNVGSLLRTADSLGVSQVYAAGITPYPGVAGGATGSAGDERDPVARNRNTRQIAKTALGAEATVLVEHFDDATAAIAAARTNGCTIYGLEQAPGSADLASVAPQLPAALVVGNEVTGMSTAALAACDVVVEIAQRGRKESLNVAVAAGIALYHFLG